MHAHANVDISANNDDVPPLTPTGILKKSTAPQTVYKSSKSGTNGRHLIINLASLSLRCRLASIHSSLCLYLNPNRQVWMRMVLASNRMNAKIFCECCSWNLIIKTFDDTQNLSGTESAVVAPIDTSKRRFLPEPKPIVISES